MAEHDARRSNFTINGLFFDPLAERVIDYVAGEADLQQADPSVQLAILVTDSPKTSSKMLRGVVCDYVEIEATWRTEVTVVSAERIGAEFERVLIHPRGVGLQLFQRVACCGHLLPDSVASNSTGIGSADYRTSTALAALLQSECVTGQVAAVLPTLPLVEQTD